MTFDKKRSQPQIKNGDILLTYIRLLCQGKTSFDFVREFHVDLDYFNASLGISYAIPSAETLRQRMDVIGFSLRKEIMQANITMFKTIDVEPTALESLYKNTEFHGFRYKILNPPKTAYEATCIIVRSKISIPFFFSNSIDLQ